MDIDENYLQTGIAMGSCGDQSKTRKSKSRTQMRVDKNARQYCVQNTAQDNCASNSIIPNSTRPSSS